MSGSLKINVSFDLELLFKNVIKGTRKNSSGVFRSLVRYYGDYNVKCHLMELHTSICVKQRPFTRPAPKKMLTLWVPGPSAILKLSGSVSDDISHHKTSMNPTQDYKRLLLFSFSHCKVIGFIPVSLT